MFSRPACLLALALLVPAPLAAHPHSWIDLDSRLIFGESGQLEAIEMDWLFDSFYTAFIAEEFVSAGQDPGPFLQEVAAENLVNLQEFDYFADLRVDDERVTFGDVNSFSTGLRDERLWLKFEVQLAEPIDPLGSVVTFAVYDPTYYIEVLYHEGHSPVLDGLKDNSCNLFVMPPTPTPEQISQAFMLDMTQTAEFGLGRYFAEIASLDCR